ncbi:MAG TPA: hypothetical protein VG347_01380 [Verrucomicrobiae bacterium]|nr:hypothetical protein [Verrucomicrobiae bacterium]
MMPEYERLIVAVLMATAAVSAIWAGALACHNYTGLNRWRSSLLWLLAVGLGVFALYVEDQQRGRTGGQRLTPVECISLVLLPLLAVPFVTRLYRKWIGGQLTAVEKSPDMDGVRAWLGVGNILCAGLIPLCIWQAYGISPVGIYALTFGLLLAYPLLSLASSQSQPASVAPAEDLSHEREKVLQLLEAGKITAPESAELLNALASSVPSPPKPAAEMNVQRKMVLLGAAVLLVGFFLPWFAINPGAIANDMAAQLQQNMGQMTPGISLPHMNLSLSTGTYQVHAGDVAHGLGWWILALGLAAAVLPFFATTLESSMQKKIILAALGVGAILLIYLLSDTIKYVSAGILLVLAGYALEVIGTLKERPAAIR